MRTCYGRSVLTSGSVLLVLCYGLCVLADLNTVTEHRAAGGSLILQHPNGSITFAQWKYEQKPFAMYRNRNITITDELQFSGRLKVNRDDLSVEVRDLQLKDSGLYSITADNTGGQLPTKMINLTVYNELKLDIESNQTWKESTNSCEVYLLCRGHGDQSVTYTWSGFQNGSGAWLNFSLSPADGTVNLTCTAVNGVSNTTSVTCHPIKATAGENNREVYMWIAIGGGVALLLLIAIITVSCWWKTHGERPSSNSGNTVYADVNPDIPARKDKRSESINAASIYETVDELRVTSDKPQTLYDKVSFPRSKPAMSFASSPYQVVL